jgi:mono/diheme cytochrome c family protein
MPMIRFLPAPRGFARLFSRSWIACLSLTIVSGLGLRADEADAAEPAQPTAAQKAEQEKFFEDRVRPVLAAHCWQCHGKEKQESDLRLDSRASVLGKSSSGELIATPGEPTKSLLIKAVRHEGDLKMPPERKLSPAEIEALEQWIAMGLPWPAGDTAPKALTASQRATADRQNHWAYQPIMRPAIPGVRQQNRLRTPIDAFIAVKQEAAGVEFSADVDRRSLARRLAFDLTGLPLDADACESFVADESPDATVRLVDRLLASPHHGERWGRHWLDVARYADTKGYAFAAERRYPYAYTYRDYVIRAHNSDTPFNHFVLEQLAADQLPPELRPANGDNSQLAALGFLTTGRKFNNVHDDIDDKIDVVSRGLLGLTVGCARCHDHKFDAIPMEDYYSLYGVFASCHEPGELPMIGSPLQNDAYRAYEAELKKLQDKRDEYVAKKRIEHTELARNRATDYLARVLADQPNVVLEKLAFLIGKPDDLRPKLVERWRDYLKKTARANDPSSVPGLNLPR